MSDITKADVVYVGTSKNGDYVQAVPEDGFAKFVRGDHIESLEEENKRLRKEIEDERSVLKAWFDTRKLGHELVDQLVIDYAAGYLLLQTSRVGGMSQEDSDMVLGVIEDMAYRSVFADIYARVTIGDEI